MADPALDISGTALAPDDSVPATDDAAYRQQFAAPALPQGRNFRPKPQITSIANDDQYGQLGEGELYAGPDKVQRQKPFTVTGDNDFAQVPEGAHYVGPDSVLRLKPKADVYGAVDFTTQTLHDMATNPSEKRKALVRGYGDQAIQTDDKGELYVVDKKGRKLKPGASDSAAGYLAANAAPVLGSIGGEIGGAALGSAAAPGVGTVAGAIAGGGAGSAAGQGVNDLIMKLAGTYDRTGGEEAANLAETGAMGALGSGVGRAIGAAKPLAQAVKDRAGQIAAWFLGTDPEKIALAKEITQQYPSVKVPLSSHSSEAPALVTGSEDFHRLFSGEDVLSKTAKPLYDNEGNSILQAVGVTDHEPLMNPTLPVSSEKAGQQVIAKVQGDMAREDAAFDTAVDTAKAAHAADYGTAKAATATDLGTGLDAAKTAKTAEIQGQSSGLQRWQEMLNTAADRASAAAQKATNIAFDSLKDVMAQARQAAKIGDNPGDLARAVAGKIQDIRQAVSNRADIFYKGGYKIAGTAPLDTAVSVTQGAEGGSSLGELGQAFLESVPADFPERYPNVVQKIAGLSDPAVQMNLEQAHGLLKMLRDGVDYTDLTQGVRSGALKRLASGLNTMIHSQTDPAIKAGVDLLDKGNAYWAQNIPAFKNKVIQGLVSEVEDGLPPDPAKVASLVLQGGQTEQANKIREMVGPVMWKAILATDTESMIQKSQSLIDGKPDLKKFSSLVLDKIENGTLAIGRTPEEVQQIKLLAQQIAGVNGKLPVDAVPGDTIFSLLRRAADAKAGAERAAAQDPIGSLTSEMKALDQQFAERKAAAAQASKDVDTQFAQSGADMNAQFAEQRAAIEAQRDADPLKFLNNASAKAIASADKIVGDPDLLIAAAGKFGPESPEFRALQQVAVERLLRVGPDKLAGKLQTGLPEEAINILFPGATKDQLLKLAKYSDFLFGTASASSGSSIAGMSRVLHPENQPHMGALKYIPVVGAPIGRVVLGNFYKLLSWGTTHPGFIHWLDRGLNGPPASMAGVREAVNRIVSPQGATGAALGGYLGNSTSSTPAVAQRSVAPHRPWRELVH